MKRLADRVGALEARTQSESDAIDAMFIHLISVAPGGGTAPFDPTYAERQGGDGRIERRADESVEAFEARAKAELATPDRVEIILMGRER
jgi:hypothetical protein